MTVDITRIQSAEQCLVDNGIDSSEAQAVLQALGYILFDAELYPEKTDTCGYRVYSKHISEVNKGDRVVYDGAVYKASTSAFLTKTDIGKEWNFEAGESDYLYASCFPGGIVNCIMEEGKDHEKVY